MIRIFDSEEKEILRRISDKIMSKKIERFGMILTAITCIIALLIGFEVTYLTKITNDTNNKLVEKEIELNKYLMFKEFATLVTDNPNTIAYYLAIEVASNTSSDEVLKKSLKEMAEKVNSYAESQIKRYVVDLFDSSSNLRSQSLIKVLDNLSYRNLNSFLDICQNEITYRSKDPYRYQGVINIMHILSCQSDSSIKNNAEKVNEFLEFLESNGYGGYSSRYGQLEKIVNNEMKEIEEQKRNKLNALNEMLFPNFVSYH